AATGSGRPGQTPAAPRTRSRSPRSPPAACAQAWWPAGGRASSRVRKPSSIVRCTPASPPRGRPGLEACAVIRDVRLVAPRGTTARDVQVAAAYFAGGLLLLAVSGGIHVLGLIEDAPRALLAGPLAVTSAGIALRRLAPVAGLGLGLAGLLGDVLLGGSLATILVFTQAVYETCVYGPAWLWRWVLRVSVALTVGSAILGPLALGQWQGLGLAVVPVLVLLLPTIAAVTVRQDRDQAAADRARAEQTARLAELDRRQTVTAERNRMARELHDVIGNRLSAVAIHASAL